MTEPLSVVAIVTASDKEPDTPAHTYAWTLSPAMVKLLMQDMMERHGQPAELLSTVGKVLAANDPQDSVWITDGDQ